MSLDPEINRLRTRVARLTGELRGVLLAVASLRRDDLTPAYRQKLLALYERIKPEPDESHCPTCHEPLSEFGDCALCRPRH